MCMARANIDIDEEAWAAVMRKYQFTTIREAVNCVLRALAAEPLSLDEHEACVDPVGVAILMLAVTRATVRVLIRDLLRCKRNSQ